MNGGHTAPAAEESDDRGSCKAPTRRPPDRQVIQGISRSPTENPIPALTCAYAAQDAAAHVLLSNGSRGALQTCPRTAIISQQAPPVATYEREADAGFEPATNAREHARNA
jgi:hypothetical protein